MKLYRLARHGGREYPRPADFGLLRSSGIASLLQDIAMDTLTLAAQPPGTAYLWSDGELPSKIPVTAVYKIDGSSVINTTVAALEVRDASDRPVKDAHATSSGFFGAVDVVVYVASPTADATKLFLQLKGGDSGTLPLKCTVLDPVSWTAAPFRITRPGPITLTANIKQQGLPADNVPLRWTPADPMFAPAFPNGPVTTTTRATDPKSYQATLMVTPDLVSKFIGQSIDVVLTVGDPTYGMAKKGLISVGLLTAPQISLFHTTVINDDLVEACRDLGIPFTIPAIPYAEEGYLVQLKGAGAKGVDIPMGATQLSAKANNLGQSFVMFVPVDNSAFAVNGPLSVTYDVLSSLEGPPVTSDVLNLTVQRSKHVDSDGLRSQGLAGVKPKSQ
jgi:hypothetical protein